MAIGSTEALCVHIESYQLIEIPAGVVNTQPIQVFRTGYGVVSQVDSSISRRLPQDLSIKFRNFHKNNRASRQLR